MFTNLYQYKVVEEKDFDLDEELLDPLTTQLNKFGLDGWRLIFVHGNKFIFEKRI